MAAGLLCQKTGPRFPRLQHHDTTRIRISVVVTVAPTGPIATKADNPNLPTQPAEIAAAVEAGYQLGASVAHMHLRDEDDRPTADLGIAGQVIDLIAQNLLDRLHGVGFETDYEPDGTGFHMKYLRKGDGYINVGVPRNHHGGSRA